MAAVAAICASSAMQQAQAGVGFGDSFDANGAPIKVPTYYANSPSGLHVDGTNSGAALRKFVDPLPLPCLGNPLPANCIPLASAEKWKRPDGTTSNDDYYEIAVVEYTQKMHSDLAKPTTLRGYVQLSTVATPGEHIALNNPDGTPILLPNGAQAYAVHAPHYLGPIIVATKGTAVRLKFYNLLPVGRYDGTKRNGDLFIPVDESLPGAGYGPDGLHKYSQNRAEVHLHGGDTPWISDGTPHQWITPAGEANAADAKSIAHEFGSAVAAADFLRGVSARNVPDMPDPGPGAVTYYFPNEQSARLMFYHDHSFGLTRLNVYAGEAAGYLLMDHAEAKLVTDGVIPADIIPLVIQDKTFVPKDIVVQDAMWNKDLNGATVTAWGGEGDLWFPHVYEFNQDPANGVDGTNPVGRWDWGPYFWPVFPALYNVPSGAYGDVSTTPEAFMDTPVVNGVAYPTMTVEPRAYRFRVLNATNDRFVNLGLYVADPATATVEATPRSNTEVKMVAAVPQSSAPYAACAIDPVTGLDIPPVYGDSTTNCWPSTWPSDGREGGVPDPTTVGPEFIQIGNEGGFLPQVAEIPVTPMGYEYNRRSITVLNAFTFGLFMGPAERADLVVDFSQYAGKTLILYNDAPAPVPAFDPRIDYYTGGPDQSGVGGAEPTQVGFGPNTRTIMQIKVGGSANGTAYDLAKLKAQLPNAYGGINGYPAADAKEKPVVAESAYNAAFGAVWTDRYANIFTGTLQQPAFTYTPGISTGFSSIQLKTQVDPVSGRTVPVGGSGYSTAPAVTITGGGGLDATAVSTLRISQVTVTDPGSGYTVAPGVTFNDTSGAGTGATGYATLKVVGVNLTNNGGSNYPNTNGNCNSVATGPAVTFSMPTAKGGVRATGCANVNGNRVRSIRILNAGTGYFSAPTVTIAPPAAGTRATATSVAGVGAITMTSANPNTPELAGGVGYTDMLTVAVNLTPPPANATAATVSPSGSVATVSLTNPGKGYTSLPAITLTGGGGSGAQAEATALGNMVVKNKAIQELFDPTFGRMNATLGIELPFTSALTQTTIPLGYVDPTTEEIADGETQIWKITHNGVDTHPVHFHLYNVQVINRIGWDGTVKPPYPNELGWKETVKMHPLEDIVVAIRAKTPKLAGFGLPLSSRPMDPSQQLGVPTGFTQVDVKTGLPAVVVNEVANYGWEYVWHCHILGHEENDFMRPVKFNANEVATAAPTNLTRVNGLLSWTDAAVTEYQYTVEGSTSQNGNTWTLLGTGLANSKSMTVPTTYARYRVTAVGATAPNGSAVYPPPPVAPIAPSNLQAAALGNRRVTVTWTDNSNNETGFQLQYRRQGSNNWTTLTFNANVVTTTFQLNQNQQSGTYQFQVRAVNGNLNSAYTSVVTATIN